VTTRDRTFLIVAGAIAVLGAFWFLALSPKRKDASNLSAQVTAAQARLQTAQASAAGAQAAKARYANDYATVARLGKAVPVDDDVPSLVYQLEHTAHDTHVDFRKIALAPNASSSAASTATTQAAAVASANGTGTTSSASAVTSALPPGVAVGSAGFPTMPFSFDFTGSFFGMQKFLKSLDALTDVQGTQINVKGRLLTVDGISLQAGPNGFPQVDATVAVTAYLLPADEGLTAGTDPAAATGAATPTATSSTSTSTPTASFRSDQ
jgi:hypothetical protein